MKLRHVPMRTCVVCREKRPKRELLRIVRTPEGEVVVDPVGRANGRGGYVCNGTVSDEMEGAGHWAEKQIRAKLGHALKVELTQQDIDRLSKSVGPH